MRRRHGASWQAIGRELQIAAESLRRWTMPDLAQQSALVPVEVVADACAVATVATVARELRVTTRGGHRVEGLSLADVIELIRVLG